MGMLPAAYVSRSEPSKVHSLATASGGTPEKVFAVRGALLVKTHSHLVWFKKQTLMPFTVAARHIFRRHVQRDTARSVRCAKANKDKRLRAYFARWMVKPYGEESVSPTIRSRKGTITFLKKSKKVKRKDGVAGTLNKNMFCITLGKKKNAKKNAECCVVKTLNTTNTAGGTPVRYASSKDAAEAAAALTPELQ